MNWLKRLFGQDLPRIYLVEVYVEGNPRPVTWITAHPIFPEMGSKMNGMPIVRCNATPLN